jgi:plastocyanin
VRLSVTAKDLRFDKAQLRVRSGAAVTVDFSNQDVGVDHNISFNLPGVGHPTCTGPCTATVEFTEPGAGTYSFICTIHAEMFGDLIVE